MLKKFLFSFIIILFIAIIIFLICNYYKTQECWWGVLYPNLSFIAIEEESQESLTTLSSLTSTKISSHNEQFNFKFALIEFFNNLLGRV